MSVLIGAKDLHVRVIFLDALILCLYQLPLTFFKAWTSVPSKCVSLITTWTVLIVLLNSVVEMVYIFHACMPYWKVTCFWLKWPWLLARWPSYTKFTEIPSRCICTPKMNFLSQGIRKLSYYRYVTPNNFYDTYRFL